MTSKGFQKKGNNATQKAGQKGQNNQKISQVSGQGKKDQNRVQGKEEIRGASGQAKKPSPKNEKYYKNKGNDQNLDSGDEDEALEDEEEEDASDASDSFEEESQEEEEEDAESEEETADEEKDSDADGDVDSEEDEVKKDGLAGSIANILGQDPKNKVAILSGRKTAKMKELEKAKKEDKAIRLKLIEKKEKLRQKMTYGSDVVNIEYERQLKKLATKGVVALFNAVAKSKRETAEEEQKRKETVSERLDEVSAEIDQLATSLSEKTSKKKRKNEAAEPEAKKKKEDEPEKGWGVLNDSNKPKQIALDWDKDEDDE